MSLKWKELTFQYLSFCLVNKLVLNSLYFLTVFQFLLLNIQIYICVCYMAIIHPILLRQITYRSLWRDDDNLVITMSAVLIFFSLKFVGTAEKLSWTTCITIGWDIDYNDNEVVDNIIVQCSWLFFLLPLPPPPPSFSLSTYIYHLIFFQYN